MVYWISTCSDQYPALKAGLPFAGLLDPGEESICNDLKTAKRRHDWLLGRLAAKLLLQRMVYQSIGTYRSLDSLVIGTGPSHAACVTGDVGQWVSISLSHSGSRAVCAAVDRPGWAIGVDIEQITRRPDGFAQVYLRDNEINLTDAATDPNLKDVLITTIWSAKEAVLKALQVGLTVETKAVSCLFDPADISEDTWLPLEIEVIDERLFKQAPALQGWRRRERDFVITLVVQKNVRG